MEKLSSRKLPSQSTPKTCSLPRVVLVRGGGRSRLLCKSLDSNRKKLKTKLNSQITKLDDVLKAVGMEGDKINILVDFIVYMALEDISFFRFLDFNEENVSQDVKDKMGNTACERFLSWIDYEYLSPKGKNSQAWRDLVRKPFCEDAGQVIANALTPWAIDSFKTMSKSRLFSVVL